MYYKVSYDQEFYDLIMYLRGKYPAKLFDLEGIGKQTDMHQFAKDFFQAKTTADASIDANANVDAGDVIGYQWEMPKPFFRMNSYFLLWEKCRDLYGLGIANRLIEQQLTGTYYINDFGDIGRPYCFNFSTYDVMLQGLPMVKKIKSVPPKHLMSFMSQLENFIVLAANSTLGATGLADLFIVMSLYVARMIRNLCDANFHFYDEEDVWSYVQETLTSFVYTINQPMRGNQSPFTNVSIFDRCFLEELCPSYKDLEGDEADVDYVMMIQELFLQVMNDELTRTPVTFPVTTACFSVDEEGNIQDDWFAQLIAKQNKRFGFINIYHGKTSTLSSCCRLRSDTTNEYFNAFGSGSTKIGSLGVVTLNLPRAAWEAGGDVSRFFALVEKGVEDIAMINNAKRQIIQSRIDKGLLPLYALGYMDINRQYSTVGLTGINEALEILGRDILTEQGQAFISRMLDLINAANTKCQGWYKAPHNCEQVPGENSCIKLASKDWWLGFNNEQIDTGTVSYTSLDKEPVPVYRDSQRYSLYSNQFIPLTTRADIIDRIRLQGMFDKQFSGGAICHINLEEPIESEELMVKLIKHCAKAGVVYWAVNYSLQECAKGHMSVGRGGTCHVCGGEIVNSYTRVVGFLVNTKNWHRVRRAEDWPKRQFYGKEDG